MGLTPFEHENDCLTDDDVIILAEEAILLYGRWNDLSRL